MEKILIKLERNDYEPDLCFFREEQAKHFKGTEMFFPPPDFVVEVLSKSTESNDRGVKFRDYQEHGVEEYWIVDVKDRFVEQYHLKNDKYELVQKSGSGTIKSFAIKGFEIPVNAIFDKQENLTTLRALIAG